MFERLGGRTLALNWKDVEECGSVGIFAISKEEVVGFLGLEEGPRFKVSL